MKILVNVDIDHVLQTRGEPAILVDTRLVHGSRAATVYLPGKLPCICDDFTSAAKLMADWIAKHDGPPKRPRR